MRTALIGHTGFVGSNLLKQYDFTDLYNTKNFQEMQSQKYDLIVCAGVSAVKWVANKEPEKDLARIRALEEVLTTVEAQEFILISTIDVYPALEGKDESFDCDSVANHAYGKHRLEFEKYCNRKFENCTIVRLPGLFGYGIKKNVIYDLLNDNCLEMINGGSSFQYYYLNNLWKDILVVRKNQIRLINLFTEPVKTQEIIDAFFSPKEIGGEKSSELHYNLYTQHAEKWNDSGYYIYTKDEVLHQLSEFILEYRKQQER